MEVQRYPKDYDGVIAGAPVYTLATQTSAVWRNTIFLREGANLTAEQIKHNNEAALAECDGRDGLVDGIVTDPRSCKFDAKQLQCPTGTKDATCLSPVQVKAANDLYSGHKTPDGRLPRTASAAAAKAPGCSTSRR